MSMIDDINNGTPEGGVDEAARRRAEKIAAIRRSVRERTENPAAAPEPKTAEKPEVKVETAASDGWEDSLSERIMKIRRAKDKKAENAVAEPENKKDTESTAAEKSAETSVDAAEDDDPNYEKTIERLAAEILAETSQSSNAADTISAEVASEPVRKQTAAELAAEILAETSGNSGARGGISAEGIAEALPEPVREPTAEEIADEIFAASSENTDIQDIVAADDAAEDIAAAEPERSAPISHFKDDTDAVQGDVAEKMPEKPAKKSKSKKKKKKKNKKSLKERILGLFPRKGDSVGECIRKVIFLASMCVIIVCGYIVSDYYLDLWKSKRINNEVKQIYNSYNDGSAEAATESGDTDSEPTYIMLDAARKLLDINKDVAGFITIPDTQVGNVVMQSKDNGKYLNSKITGEESRAGEVFLDYRCHFDDMDEEGHRVAPDTNNLIIYGHNMADESMFGCLKYYERNYDYYGQHPIIELNSNYARYKYKIFAFFIVDAEDKSDTAFDCWNQLNFNTEEDFYDFVNEAKRRTLRLNDVDVKYGDSLITLSTCNTLLGDNGRLIILARRLRDGEDELEGTQNSTENPNIKWPNLYYEYKSTAKRYDPNAEFVPYGPDSDEKTEETATEANN